MCDLSTITTVFVSHDGYGAACREEEGEGLRWGRGGVKGVSKGHLLT